MKPSTRRGPKKGKKTLESCDVQKFDHQVNAVVVYIWRNTETNGKQQLGYPN